MASSARKARPRSLDPAAQAAIARARRVAECERAVAAALAPLLARYDCRLGTLQEIKDGQPGAVRIVVLAND